MILKANSYSIGRKSGEIWTSQTLLQPISFKSDRLLAVDRNAKTTGIGCKRSLEAECSARTSVAQPITDTVEIDLAEPGISPAWLFHRLVFFQITVANQF